MAIMGNEVYQDREGEIECCDKSNCPGTCPYCGFSKCPEAMDIDRCDGKGMCEVEATVEAAEMKTEIDATVRGFQLLWDYRKANNRPAITNELATDLIADILHALPGAIWRYVIERAIEHAHEERHGWGTATNLHISLDGLEYVPRTERKTWTVTLSGREREDGEEPYTWVLYARSPWEAVMKAMDIHVQSQEEEYGEVRVEELFEGLPPEDCGYYWNDEREATKVG